MRHPQTSYLKLVVLVEREFNMSSTCFLFRPQASFGHFRNVFKLYLNKPSLSGLAVSIISYMVCVENVKYVGLFAAQAVRGQLLVA